MPTIDPPRDMGGDRPADPAGTAQFDDAAGHACSCSQDNADELHSLVVALAAHHGIDVCGHDMHDMDDDDGDDEVIELHDLDDIDDDDVPEDDDEDDSPFATDLQLIHDVLVSQGAHCSGMDDDDEDDEDDLDDDSSGEHPAFSVDDEPDEATDDATSAPVTFRDWPKAKRDKTPAEDFGDPSNEAYPIMDQADVDAAAKLIGRAADPEAVKAKIKAIAKKKGLTIPAAWAAEDTANMGDGDTAPDPSVIHGLATFDLDSPVIDGEFVRYEGARIFKPGDYPRRQFSMSPDELRSAVTRFKGSVPAEIEHVNSAGTATFLDGEFGSLENVRLADDGWMVGDVVLDKWVDRKWDKFLAKAGETRKQVSAVWNRATKDIERLGLVIRGHVEGAALNAAFSDRDDDSAIDAMFATPRKTTEDARKRHQHIHDFIGISYPHICNGTMAPGTNPADPDNDGDIDAPAAMPDSLISHFADHPDDLAAYFADHPLQMKAFRQMHRMTTDNGAQCKGSGKVKMSDESNPSRSKTMSKTDDAPEITDAELAEFVESSDPYKAILARAEAAEKRAEAAEKAAKEKEALFAEQAEAARVKSVEDAAKAFANGLIAEGRSTSAEFTDLVLLYTDAAHLDHKTGETVTFSDAAGAKATGSRVDRLKAREAKRPAHTLFSPALGDGQLLHDGERILFNDKASQDTPATVEAERVALLKKTPAGLAILARDAASKKGN